MAASNDSSSWTLVLKSSLVLLAGVTVRFCVKMFYARRQFQSMQKAGLVSLITPIHILLHRHSF